MSAALTMTAEDAGKMRNNRKVSLLNLNSIFFTDKYLQN